MTKNFNKKFSKFAQRSALVMGSPLTFAIASGFTIIWAISGFFVGFSSQHQLIINTISTITTGLGMFLVQNTQNRDSRAMQIKLNEIIRSNTEARNKIIDLEDAEEEEAKLLQKEFKQIREDE